MKQARGTDRDISMYYGRHLSLSVHVLPICSQYVYSFSSFVIDAWWIHVYIVSLVFLGICVFLAIEWLFNFSIHRDRPDWFYLFLYLMFIYFLDYRIYIIPFSATKPKVFSHMLASALLLSHNSRNSLQVRGTIDS